MRAVIAICVLLSVAVAYQGKYQEFASAGSWADEQRQLPFHAAARHVHQLRENVARLDSHASVHALSRGVSARADGEVLCLLAVGHFLEIVNGSTGACHDVDATVQSIYGDNGQAAAATFCTGCAAAARESIAAVALACAGVIQEDDARNLREAFYFLSATCIQDNTETHYCIPQIVSTFKAVGNSSGMISTDLLSTTCGGGCFLRFAAAVVTLNPDFNSTDDDSIGLVYFGAIVCAVDTNPSNVTASGPGPVYCINQLHVIANAFSGSSIQDGFNAICATRCIEKYAILAGEFNQEFFTNETIICHRASEGGELCINKVFDGPINPDNIDLSCDFADNNGPPNGNSPCDTGVCRGNVTAFATQMGCCLTDYIILATHDNDDARADVFNWLQSSCMVTVAAPCPTFQSLVTNFVVYGLVTQYCHDHPGVCEAALAYDIAVSLGLLNTNINVTAPVAGGTRRLLGDATSFTVSINTDGTAQKTSTQNDLNTAVQNNGIIYAQTSQLPAGAKANAFGVVGTSPAAVTFATGTTTMGGASSTTTMGMTSSTTGTASSAAAVMPLFGAVIAALVALML